MKKTLISLILISGLLLTACASPLASTEEKGAEEAVIVEEKGAEVVSIDINNDFHKLYDPQRFEGAKDTIDSEQLIYIGYNFYLDEKDISERPFVEVYDSKGLQLHFGISEGLNGRYHISVKSEQPLDKIMFSVKSKSDFEINLYDINPLVDYNDFYVNP